MACRLNRSRQLTKLCRFEAKTHEQTFFVTLTYADKYLPRASFLEVEPEKYVLIDEQTGEVLSDEKCELSYVEKLQRKVKSKYIPYLLKNDVQLFLKRLRKSFPENQIRYFLCGEYGPKHFRPHYHLLLWFEKPQLARPQLPEVVSKKWPFGRVDVQVAADDCAKYVAGYTASFSYIPSILRNSFGRPFTLHSTRLGFEFIERYYGKNPLSAGFESFDKIILSGNERISELSNSRAYQASIYPRPRRYNGISDDDRFRSLTIFRDVSQEIPLKHEAINIVSYVRNYLREGTYQDGYARVIRHFVETCPAVISPDTEQFIGVVYRDLLLSKKFCKNSDRFTYLDINKGDYYGQHYSRDKGYFTYILSFYNYKDLKKLAQFYEVQSKILESEDNISYDIFYDENLYLQTLQKTKSYQRFALATSVNYDNSIKHKYQNDLNNLLYG